MENKNDTYVLNDNNENQVENNNIEPGEVKMKFPKTISIFLGLGIFIVLAIFFINTFWFSCITISGSAMEPTVNSGEVWIIDRTAKKYSRDDIITFYSDENSKNANVSRVIAVADDTIYIDFTTGEVYVNNVVIDEPYIKEETMTSGEYIDELISSGEYGMSKAIKLDQGELFVMGDNRGNSRDSREFGPVEVSNVFGVVNNKIK